MTALETVTGCPRRLQGKVYACSAAKASARSDTGDIHTLCPSCGRVYRNFDIEHENEAPVVLTVYVAKGPIADAIKIHWQNA
ncbi:putative RNA-binding Zn-ribbon protein involved in translation (DUF1610 family) [Pseudarthrobacter oxydans]|uniref:hypothetical protein n=1 Tax=Pseudarthrobacter oxydans TaxID=1671 RepID=UPI0027872578|nr:hypothetical protein [Pseudarthrobacter oxydans]MDP9983089.1 putative RNA-binding Zn-ribbon protein involved in translation (DUF1610 family) [Pseudarthrobacter oxydans]